MIQEEFFKVYETFFQEELDFKNKKESFDLIKVTPVNQVLDLFYTSNEEARYLIKFFIILILQQKRNEIQSLDKFFKKNAKEIQDYVDEFYKIGI